MVDKRLNILEYTNTNYAIEQFQLKYFCSFFSSILPLVVFRARFHTAPFFLSVKF